MQLVKRLLLSVVLMGLSSSVFAQSHPEFYLTPTRVAQWEAMKASYDANPANPATYGGVFYKHNLAQASAGRYYDSGMMPALLYQITGEQAWADQAWYVMTNQIGGGSNFINRDEVCDGTGLHGNWSRAYGIRLVTAYDWAYDGWTTDQRNQFIAKMNLMAGCVGGPADTYRPGDSDRTVGYYMFVAMWYLATKDYNPTIVTYWNDADRKLGGLTQTASDMETYRNSLYYFTTTKAEGGAWIEGYEYNSGTVALLLAGAEAIKTATGVDYFPEVTAWVEDAAEKFMHDISPNIHNYNSLPYKWGDTENPRNMKSYGVFRTGLMLAGLNEGNAVGPRIQDFVLDWLDSTGSISDPDPQADWIAVFNPDATRGDHSQTTDWHYAAGEMQLTGRTGWGVDDSWFSTRSDPPREVDHDTVAFGEFQYWKNGQWAITHPLTYNGVGSDSRGTNGLSMAGQGIFQFGPQEYRRVLAYGRETTAADFLYISGTEGGSTSRDPEWGMPHTYWHEHTRSMVWLPTWDVLVIHDRTNADTEPDLTYPVGPTLNDWMASRPLKEIYFHALNEPTITDNHSDWTYDGTNAIRVTHLLPASVTNYIEYEPDLYVWPPYPWHGSPDPGEANWHVRQTPASESKWDTFLNVWDIYDTGTPATVALVQDTSNDVDAALVTKGTENYLLAFNAIQGPDVPDRWKGDQYCTPASTGGYGCHDEEAVAAVLDTVRIRDTSYSLTFTPAAGSTTTAVLFDLDTGTEWDYNIDGGANSSLTVDANGIGIIDITDTGFITLNVLAGGAIPVSVSTATLPNGTKDSAYSETLAAIGGDGGPYTWSVTVGSLPTNLSLSGGGVLSGTPTIAESETFTVQACDSTPDCGTRELSLTIDDLPTIITTSLDDGVVGVAYSDTVAGSGGSEPYTFSVQTGSLCDGLSLAGATGVISGTPTTVETCEFTIRLTDDDSDTDDQEFNISSTSGIGTVTVRSEPGSTGAVVHYGVAGLPFDASCTVQLKEGDAVIAEATSTTGAARRIASFSSLQEDTAYEVAVTCDVAVSSPGSNTVTTLSSAGVGTVTYTVTLTPSALLVAQGVDEVRIGYGEIGGSPGLSADTECSSGCTIDIELNRGSVYYMRTGWLDGTAVVRASKFRYFAAQ